MPGFPHYKRVTDVRRDVPETGLSTITVTVYWGPRLGRPANPAGPVTSHTSGPLWPGSKKPGSGTAGQRRADRGFTLIELLVVLAIQGILLAAVVTSFTGQLTAHGLQEQLNAMQQNARAAMTLVIRDARTAGVRSPRVRGLPGWRTTPAA